MLWRRHFLTDVAMRRVLPDYVEKRKCTKIPFEVRQNFLSVCTPGVFALLPNKSTYTKFDATVCFISYY